MFSIVKTAEPPRNASRLLARPEGGSEMVASGVTARERPGGWDIILLNRGSRVYVRVVAQYEGDKSTISFCCQFLTTDGQKSRGGILKRKENK